MVSEEQLALRARAGDAAAFDELVERMGGLAFSFAQKFYGPGLELDDLRQAALVGLWSFSGFAAMCMRRSVISTVIAARRLKHQALDGALSLDAELVDGDEAGGTTLHDVLPAPNCDPVALLASREDLDLVTKLIRGLTPLQRDVAIGFMNDETYHAIGERLGFRVYERSNGKQRCKTVDNALQRVRRKVIAVLGEDVRRRPLGVAA
jgi:RNA polymerase sporulation-specific sigma factor